MSTELPALPSRRSLWVPVLIGVVLTLAVTAALATRTLHIGSGRGGWVYPFVQPFTWRAATIAVGVSVLAGLTAIAVERWTARTWTLLLTLMCAGLGAEGTLRAIAPVPLAQILVSDGANGFYTVAGRYPPLELLGRFNRVRAESPLHVQSNLPGKSLLLSALRLLSDRPAVLVWILIALSTSGAVLMFAFVRELLGDRRIAIHAAALYLFVPARLAFVPLMNTITPVFALLFAWLFLRALRRGTIPSSIAAGAALYALVLFEPLPLVLGLLLGVAAAASVARAELSTARLVRQAAMVAGAFIAASEATAATTGFELVGAFHSIARHAAAFNEAASRPYQVWIGANLIEFVLAMGVCPAVLLMGVLINRPTRAYLGARLLQPITVTALGLLGVLIVTDLIGINRGEVSRLWIFLACFFQIPAAWCCAQAKGAGALAAVAMVTALQASVAIAVIGFVLP